MKIFDQIYAHQYEALLKDGMIDAARRIDAMRRDMQTVEAASRAAEEWAMLRETEAVRQVAKQWEIMRRDREAMQQAARHVKELGITHDLLVRQAEAIRIAHESQLNLESETARAQAVRKEIADVLLARELERENAEDTPDDNVAGSSADTRQIEKPPGANMLAWAQRWLSPKSVELMIEPGIADYRHEIFEAIKLGFPETQIKRIHYRHRAGLVLAVVCIVAGLVGGIFKAARGK